ncbi:MAG: flagellar protein, partial [Pseudomonadota bacterium]
ALGLPSEIAAVDIDRQLEVFREKSQSVFGVSNPAEFADPELQEQLVRNFLFRSELDSASSSSLRGSVALSLLQSQPSLF